MNIRDLEYLVKVDEYRHFGKAAKACFISQPALSMQLIKLEETLNVKLFERGNKQVLVTNIGEKIIIRAKKILQEIEDIKHIAALNSDVFAGKYIIGAFPTLAPYYLPKIILKINKSLPGLKLLLVEEKTDILLNKLQEGKIDAAFLALPVEADNLIYHEIFKDEFLLTVYRSHPLAKKKSIIYQDLKNETLLLLEEGHCMRNQALQLCNISGIRENNNFRATSLETLRQTVISGSGITLIPAIAALPNKNLVYIKFKAPKPERTIAFITRKSSPKLEIFEKISNLCKTK